MCIRDRDIDKRWDFLHFGLTGTSAFDPAKNDPLSRAVLGEHSLEDGIDGFLGLTDVYKRQAQRRLNALTDMSLSGINIAAKYKELQK